ncbi:MAG TPA: DUF4339 domain-containing protein [Tepidisphaeraceae bacterium]|jgi:hypothetical protein|nr:DUF4339 domain-containing protein [Tepidisphaeraceae bacterium]
MANQWYYVRDGERRGPVTAEQLKGMAATGSLTPDDLVWTDYMSEWLPARRVPALVFPSAAPAAAPEPANSESFAPAPVQVQSLAYQTPGGDATPVTPRTIDMLRQTRPWVIFFAVLMFLGAGFLLIGSVIGMFAAMQVRSGLVMIGPALNIAMSLLYIFPAVFLWRYASRIADLSYRKRAGDLESALEAQKSYWKFLGIVTLVVIGLGIVVVLVAVVAGVAAFH